MSRKICVLDVETTGRSARDEVIQLAYLIIDEDTMNLVHANSFYCFSNQRIDPGAYKAHGVNRETLLELSQGIYLEETLSKDPYFMGKVDDPILFTSFNAEFDLRMIRQTLYNNCDLTVNFGKEVARPSLATAERSYFCSMKFLPAVLLGLQKTKLETLSNKTLAGKYDDIPAMHRTLCKIYSLPAFKNSAHDALYDCILNWLLLKEAKEKRW